MENKKDPATGTSAASDPDILYLAGVTCFNLGDYERAIDWISAAIRQDPKPLYLANLGACLAKQGRTDDALRSVDKAIELAPNDATLWFQLGNILIDANRRDEALLCFRQAVQLDARQGEAAYKAGHLLHGLGRLEEALGFLEISAAELPDHAPAHHVRALVLKEMNRLEEARLANLRAIDLDPARAEAYGSLANILQALGRNDEALHWYDRSLANTPDDARTITNRALSLADLRRFSDAAAEYERALAIEPGLAEAAWNLSLLHLLMGDFRRGWQGREARWKMPLLSAGYPKLPTPFWNGEDDIAGKTFFVCADEGLGDAIQFVRYVPMLAARGATVILAAEQSLCPLLSDMPGVHAILPKSDDSLIPEFDFHCALGSLPLAFGTTLDTIPATQSYLPTPSAARMQAWEHRLGPRTGKRIGLVWSGNPKHANDRNRSMTFKTMARLLDVDARFVSLQKDLRFADQEALRTTEGILDLTADLADFTDTAALISCLDLVITVDTSVAHLSAALGKPTWILLPYMPDYRWLLDRDDSPWYPSVRLFRQSPTREYASVIDLVREALDSWLTGHV
jgi:tetratricopeptide (TPR) repeat protein/ADP-heptose:LPS heptosyltransferase